GANTVTLGLQYTARALNTADASWRGAVLDDSRFLRESALAHTASGWAWAQGWAANTERQGAHGLPADDRDARVLQIGVSRPAGSDGFLAAFVGTQDTRLASLGSARPSAAAGGTYHPRDRAMHLGLEIG